MTFGRSHRLKAMNDMEPIKFNNNVVEEVDHFKYLGVILDQNITFEKHVNYLRSKVFNSRH